MVLEAVEGARKSSGKTPDRKDANGPKVWEVFKWRWVRRALEGTPPAEYGELVGNYGLRSNAEAHNLLATGKRKFARHLWAVFGQYERRPEFTKEELDDIKSAFARSFPKKPRTRK